MTENIDAVVATKAGGLISSSALAVEMDIFQDPIYLWLALIGSFISMLGLIYDHFHCEDRHGKGIPKVITELFKAVLVGALITPMAFMLYMHMGDELVAIEGFKGIMNSFWFLASLVTSWYAIPALEWAISFKRGQK